jgi:hypothetical protein
MISVPNLIANLISSPDPLPDHALTFGAGRAYDFNVHVISREPGIRLPVGEYVFTYEAKCEEDDSSTRTGTIEV